MQTRTRVAAVGALGLVVLLIGTFLPWLRSGRAERNSYRTTGTIRRLLDPDGVAGELFKVWPLVGLACALVGAAYVLRLRALAAVLGVLVAAAAGGGAFAALLAAGSTYASVIDTGPVVTLVGAILVLVSAVIELALGVRARATGRSTS